MVARPVLRRIVAALACALVAACGDGVETITVGKPPVEDPSAMPRAPRLALVLSSGGPRGFAHIGVLKVLAEAGIRPDIVVGTSSGAFVGVLYAANPSPADLEARALALGGADVFDYDVFRQRIPGGAMQAWLNAAIGGAPLDGLALPVAVVATRQDDGRPVAFTRGDAGAAVRASSAVPGSFAPVRIGGVVYVDGDIAAPLPVAIARGYGARRVVAVDVAQNVERAPAPEGAPASWTEEAIERRRKIAREEGGADVVIAPRLPYLTGFSTDYRRMAIATGEQAARDALPRLRALLE
jgi:NTE family protein